MVSFVGVAEPERGRGARRVVRAALPELAALAVAAETWASGRRRFLVWELGRPDRAALHQL